jgi:uncharacterized protein Yka (UPF0111/DUF47 family)
VKIIKSFSKERVFYKMFEPVVSNIMNASSLLVSIMQMENFYNVRPKVKEMFELEQEGDILTHDILKKLSNKRYASIDRKVIHTLTCRLDDVLDLIWASADKLSIFKLDNPTEDALQISENLLMMIESMARAIGYLKEMEYFHIQNYCIEINELENKIDRFFIKALKRLFDESEDPKYIIKWKDIYQHLEDASDRCEDVSNILEMLAMKQTSK